MIVAAPTNYNAEKNYFDTSAVEAVIELVLKVNPEAVIVIKSTVPVGYTKSVREKVSDKKSAFFPRNFCGKERLCMITFIHPGLSWERILANPDLTQAARTFAELLEGGRAEGRDPTRR